MKEMLPNAKLMEEFERVIEKNRTTPTITELEWMKRNRILESKYTQGDIFNAIFEFLEINSSKIADRICEFAYLFANRWYPKTIFTLVDNVKEFCKENNLDLAKVITILDYFKLRWKEK